MGEEICAHREEPQRFFQRALEVLHFGQILHSAITITIAEHVTLFFLECLLNLRVSRHVEDHVADGDAWNSFIACVMINNGPVVS